MNVNIISHTPDPMQAVELAAAKCYNSQPTKEGRIAKSCFANGHTSVFEHAVFEFEIEGVSRALLAQLTRYRCASYTVRSQRYCDEGEFEYVTPDSIANEYADEYQAFMLHSSCFYRFLVAHDIPKEDARFVLPNACTTTLVMTMNVRELTHFCNERMCTKAQWEIRTLANKIKDAVMEVDARLGKILVPECEKSPNYGHYPQGSKSCGRH